MQFHISYNYSISVYHSLISDYVQYQTGNKLYFSDNNLRNKMDATWIIRADSGTDEQRDNLCESVADPRPPP